MYLLESSCFLLLKFWLDTFYFRVYEPLSACIITSQTFIESLFYEKHLITFFHKTKFEYDMDLEKQNVIKWFGDTEEGKTNSDWVILLRQGKGTF